ncbi:MFS general substrate transporter [Rhizopogon vinicolor AM-OR11-026]|uniref:MFS general substrate transporter n=1 Tax=Rhizopogon vinicolor AM-OR11-026 TaxID=1314800 RepID=A0A1B7MPV0_9AGAM|nr:MFS general substrate transporter [Rhizopogon vinicolor AM-OR11-026]
MPMSATYEKSEELGHKQSPESPTPLESDIPDGGFQAWATVFGCFLIQFCGFGYVLSFGVYQDFYTRIYLTNYPPTAISWIGSLASFLGDSISLISGPLYDRGWFYTLMIVGSSLQSLSLFILSLAKPDQFYLVFMIQGVLAGIGIGLAYAPSMAVISQHFSKRRTLAMALVVAGTPLGAVAHSIMLNHLLNRVGFSRGVLVSAGFVSALLLIACLSMRTRALPTPSGASYRAAARKCSRDVLFILMTTGATLFQVAIYFPLFYLQLDSVKHGIGVNFSFYSLVIMNASAFIARCTTGMIAPYMGVLNLTIVSTVVCSALIISMIALVDIASGIVICVVYGYFYGVFVALAAPLVVLLTPDLSELGARLGISLVFVGACPAAISEPATKREWLAFGGLLGGPISGALLGSQYKWLIPTLFSGLIAFCGSFVFASMRLIIYYRRKSQVTRAETA